MIPKIIWREAYEIGIKEIDEQHKTLVEMINLTIQAKYEGTQNSVLREVLFGVIQFTKTHFAAEEEHMKKNLYPGFQAHKIQHAEMIDEIVGLLQQLHKGEQSAIMNLSDILKSWLLNHILKRDIEYGNFLMSLKNDSAGHTIHTTE